LSDPKKANLTIKNEALPALSEQFFVGWQVHLVF